MTKALGSSFVPTVPVSSVEVPALDELAASAGEVAADDDVAAALLDGAAAALPESSLEPHPAASVSVARAHAAASFLMDDSPDLKWIAYSRVGRGRTVQPGTAATQCMKRQAQPQHREGRSGGSDRDPAATGRGASSGCDRTASTATSSSAPSASSTASRRSHSSSSGCPARSASTARSRARPWSRSPVRRSNRPSVNNSSVLPGSRTVSPSARGPDQPMPSGGADGGAKGGEPPAALT